MSSDPTQCDHAWGQYLDLPYGEEPFRHWQCIKCGVLGYRKHHGYGGRRERPTRILKCVMCGSPATGRLKGRSNAGRIRWVCREHGEAVI